MTDTIQPELAAQSQFNYVTASHMAAINQRVSRQGIAFATPQTAEEEAGLFLRLLRDMQRERDELAASNKILVAELTALRTRTAERDASVAWAIRRGRTP